MFEYLKGRVEYKKPNYLALDVNGVGYKINISLRVYDRIKSNEEIKLYIYSHIKEDCFRLIGFLEESERELFEMLLGVKGIGVNLVLSIMSTFNGSMIKNIINDNDYKALTKVPKLGEKKSQQIILDLKNKIKKLGVFSLEENGEYHTSSIIEAELYEAMEVLGYSQKEIDKLVSKEEIRGFKTLEEGVKFVLKKV